MKKWIEELQAEPWSKAKKANDQPAFNWALNKTAGQVCSVCLSGCYQTEIMILMLCFSLSLLKSSYETKSINFSYDC